MLHKLRRIALCAWCLLPPRPAVATPTPGSSSGHHSQSQSHSPPPHPDHRILKDVTRAIGGTPLVDLSRIVERYGLEGRILAKLEYLSPGASKKDLIALSILEAAREEGLLQPGQPVVELTSGNTGTGLAIVCAVWGHPFVAVMSRGNSEERAAMMEALGATVVLVDQAREPASAATTTTNAAACNRSTKESSCCGYGRVTGADLDRVEQRASELATSMGAFRVDQFVRGANREAHFSGTGPELWRDSGGILTDFVDFVGTGGSFGGIASFLKRESGGGVRCYVVEPEGAAVLRDAASGVEREDGYAYESHRIQGGGYLKRGDDLPLIRGAEASPAKSGGGDDCNRNANSDGLLADGYLTVSDDEAISAARDLARYEGIFGGFSGGANLAAAVKLLRRRALERRNECLQHQNRPPGDDVVAILVCDSGLKYMSTDLWKQ